MTRAQAWWLQKGSVDHVIGFGVAGRFAERRILDGSGGFHAPLPRRASRLAGSPWRSRTRLRSDPGCPPHGKGKRVMYDWIGVMMAALAVGIVVAVYVTGA
jgi:hypothetical protein